MSAKAKTKDEDKTRIKIGKKVIDLDIDSLTLGESEELEIALAAPLPQIQGLLEQGSVRAMKWVAFIIYRRTHERATIDDFNSVKITEVGDAEKAAGKDAELEASGDQST